MPRAQSQPEGGSSSSQPSQFLKRRQACHQCRRRKLKCDAEKPCSPCVKSHRFASYSNPELLQIGPECTYDDLTPEGTLAIKPRTKYRILEDKIRGLESLLTQQSKEKESPSAGPSVSSAPIAPIETPRETDLFDSANILDPLMFIPLEQSSAMNNPRITDSPSDHSGQQLVISGWPTRLIFRTYRFSTPSVLTQAYFHT
ncbi:hypothetical protein RSAG8_05421, partial [Rhizoctonia solani AG-8 WAC10335]